MNAAGKRCASTQKVFIPVYRGFLLKMGSMILNFSKPVAYPHMAITI